MWKNQIIKRYNPRGLLSIFIGLCLIVFFQTSSVQAIDIQEVTSPGGIKAWLVEAHDVPLLDMNFSFDGGSVNDAAGKEGTALFLSGMMDEGAGNLDGAAFREIRDRLSISMRFNSAAENFFGDVYTLSKNRDAAFDLLGKAITQPRFEAEPLERMRAYYKREQTEGLKDPGSIATLAWSRLAFPDHVYSRESGGTDASLANITAEDLRQFHKSIFSRRGLKIAVVGDIDAKSLGLALDKIFGSLPDTPVPKVALATEVHNGGTTKVIDFDTPQSVLLFGGKGDARSGKTDYAAYLLSEIVGGDASFSRLNREVREKRGLSYGTSFSLNSLEKAGYSLGYIATANETAGEALRVTKDVLKQIAENGPTPEELALAKTFITGAYALRFSGTSAIANNLLSQQLNDYPITHIKTRNDKVNAVTLEQVKEQAKRLLQPDQMIVVVVGKPIGIER